MACERSPPYSRPSLRGSPSLPPIMTTVYFTTTCPLNPTPLCAPPILPPYAMQSLQQQAAALALALLVASSECHLHSRLPGSRARARDTAAEALSWARGQPGLSPAPAHHQLGRVHRAEGDLTAAEAELVQVSAVGM